MFPFPRRNQRNPGQACSKIKSSYFHSTIYFIFLSLKNFVVVSIMLLGCQSNSQFDNKIIKLWLKDWNIVSRKLHNKTHIFLHQMATYILMEKKKLQPKYINLDFFLKNLHKILHDDIYKDTQALESIHNFGKNIPPLH